MKIKRVQKVSKERTKKLNQQIDEWKQVDNNQMFIDL